jgi:predicted O-methyltransferase YrrM
VWLARALPTDGKMISLELRPYHIEIARKNFKLAGLESKVELREGDAGELIDQMIKSQEDSFDLIFIDADKENYPLYLDKVLKLSHPGTLILSDNLIPKSEEIGPPQSGTVETMGVYQFNHAIASHPQLESILATTIVGKNGRLDAIGISIVKECS